MIKFFTFLLCLIIWINFFQPAIADDVSDTPECISTLDHDIDIGDRLNIKLFDGAIIAGLMYEISYELAAIRLNKSQKDTLALTIVPFEDTESISYYKRGRVKPLYLFGGLSGGAILGGIVGGAVGKKSDAPFAFSEIEGGVTGMLIGAAAGLTLGIVASLNSKYLVTIRCDF